MLQRESVHSVLFGSTPMSLYGPPKISRPEQHTHTHTHTLYILYEICAARLSKCSMFSTDLTASLSILSSLVSRANVLLPLLRLLS